MLATARSHRNALEYISDDPKLELIPYEKRYERIGECDCIISATSSPHYTVTADMLSDNENKLFIDLAVPRDIDPAVEKLAGARLIDMDFFTELAKENNLKNLTAWRGRSLSLTRKLTSLKSSLCSMIFFRSLRALTEDFARFRRKNCFQTKVGA